MTVYVTETHAAHYTAVDVAGNEYTGPYHALMPRESLLPGDEIQAQDVRGSRLHRAKRTLRAPAVLTDTATATVHFVGPRFAFARDLADEGGDYLIPVRGLALGQVVSGRVEAGRGGQLPVILPA